MKNHRTLSKTFYFATLLTAVSSFLFGVVLSSAAQTLQATYAIVSEPDADCSSVAVADYIHTTKPTVRSGQYICRKISVTGQNDQFSQYPIDGIEGIEPKEGGLLRIKSYVEHT